MSTILITGSNNGLGHLLAKYLEADRHNVYGYDITDGFDVRKPDTKYLNSIGDVDVLINNAAVNKINWLQDVSSDEWDEVVDVNAKGIFMMTQALLPSLIRTKGTVLNIVSNASHMPMTCSLAYNASKGAAYIMTLQLARELTKTHGITVFGISPNKLEGTNMSDSIDEQVVTTRGWSAKFAKEYQLKGLLTGEETSPSSLAEFIAFLLSRKSRHAQLSGCILPYGA